MTALARSRPASVLHAFGWYPLALALAWFVQVLLDAEVELAPAVRPLAAFVLVPVALTLACTWLLGRERGTLLAAAAVVALITVRTPAMLLPFIALVPLLLVERRWSREGRLKLPWVRLHEALTILAAILLILQVARLLAAPTSPGSLTPAAWAGEGLEDGDRPDIYLVLADAHGRADILRDDYGYDPRPFLGALESSGFQVASRSRSNYLLTRFSLASMLTGAYLRDLQDPVDEKAADRYARQTIKQNPAFPLLRRAGYEVNVVSSGYEHLGLRGADRYIDTGQANEFESAVMRNVAASGLIGIVGPGWDMQGIRDRTVDNLQVLQDMGRTPHEAPQFTIVHVPVPHWPWVYDASCGPAEAIAAPAGIGRTRSPATVAAVADQTRCVDRMLEDAIATLTRDAPDAVVILFSDHGPDEYLDWKNPDAAGISERSSILFAARTPGRTGVFPDDISLVNVLPTLFNAYLGTDLPVRPTEIWFGPQPRGGPFARVDQSP